MGIGRQFRSLQLARSPGFALVAVLTLALGIGPTTAIFSAVEAVVLRRFDFAHPGRTVIVQERWRDQAGSASAGNYVDWQRRSTGFEQLAAIQPSSFNLSEAETPERVVGARVTWNYFAVAWQGMRPILLGTVAGTIGAMWFSRLVRGSVYGVSTTDPATFAAVAATLMLVGLIAAYIPAHRSPKTDPTQALR